MRSVEGGANVTVRPAVTTFYRLRSPAAATAPVRVVVEAAPRFLARQSAGALTGTATPGDVVQIQRPASNGNWVTTAVALAHEDGTWKTMLDVVAGEYRAYVAARGSVRTSPALTFVAA